MDSSSHGSRREQLAVATFSRRCEANKKMKTARFPGIAWILLWSLGSFHWDSPGQQPNQPGTNRHIVIVTGENEYQTAQTLPLFSATHLVPRGLRVSYVHASTNEGANIFANYNLIASADLVLVSVRRRAPENGMLSLLRAHVSAGKPVVGIRTASHAFDTPRPDEAHGNWTNFDAQVLGARYEGHYGNKPPTHPATVVRVVPEYLGHPVMTGVEPAEFRVTSHLYKYRNLIRTVTPLLRGQVEGRSDVEPVAWINSNDNRRVFYTSLGSPEDFALPVFQRLL